MPNAVTAIDAALKMDWKKAIELNLVILENNPKDLSAQKRLGYAYLNNGNLKKAKSTYEKILKVDPFNPIAIKNLKKAKENRLKSNNNIQKISPTVFIEEPGITKCVDLINLASKSVLVNQSCGQTVKIITKKNRIEIRNEENEYLGALPDDLSFRLRKLTRLGNQYSTYIKSISDNELMIIIREIKRGKRVKDASFSIKLIPNYHTSIRSELLEELLEEDSSSPVVVKPDDDSEPDNDE